MYILIKINSINAIPAPLILTHIFKIINRIITNIKKYFCAACTNETYSGLYTLKYKIFVDKQSVLYYIIYIYV